MAVITLSSNKEEKSGLPGGMGCVTGRNCKGFQEAEATKGPKVIFPGIVERTHVNKADTILIPVSSIYSEKMACCMDLKKGPGVASTL